MRKIGMMKISDHGKAHTANVIINTIVNILRLINAQIASQIIRSTCIMWLQSYKK
jgi:hypothetical protein